MYDFNTNSDWSRNKKSDSIIYTTADGDLIEITLESFLADSPTNTEDMFYELKSISDKLFQQEDIAECKHTRHQLSLFDGTRKYATKTLEDEVVGASDNETNQAAIIQQKQMLNLAPKALDKLTETQRRRFILHKVNRLTTRRIARIERVSQQAVCKSINGAEKKIKIFFQKNKQNVPKRVVKNDDR